MRPKGQKVLTKTLQQLSADWHTHGQHGRTMVRTHQDQRLRRPPCKSNIRPQLHLCQHAPRQENMQNPMDDRNYSYPLVWIHMTFQLRFQWRGRFGFHILRSRTRLGQTQIYLLWQWIHIHPGHLRWSRSRDKCHLQLVREMVCWKHKVTGSL